MIKLEDQPRTACELKSRRGSAYSCITDADGDGRFETYFLTQVFNEIFLGSIGDDFAVFPLAGSVEITEIDAQSRTPDIGLELKVERLSKGVVKYRICLRPSWEGKYYKQAPCSKEPVQAELDDSGRVSIQGQRVRLIPAEGKPSSVIVESSPSDFEFSTSFSLF
ncbi:hypothetical protein GCM10023264_18040 [Sphingomonas daechungensis]